MSGTSIEKPDMNIPVDFSQLSIGETSARLGIKIDRSKFDSEKCEDLLCGSRLEAELQLGEDGQQELDGIEPINPILTTIDIKGYSAKINYFSAGLTFNITEVDVSHLAHFAQKPGRLIAKRIGESSPPTEDEI